MRSFLFPLLLLLSSCTVYSSGGRKSFESRSPDYIRTQAFTGCAELSGENEHFQQNSFYRNDYFWAAADPQTSYKILLWDLRKDEVCHYDFKNQDDWQNYQSDFLEYLDQLAQ